MSDPLIERAVEMAEAAYRQADRAINLTGEPSPLRAAIVAFARQMASNTPVAATRTMWLDLADLVERGGKGNME